MLSLDVSLFILRKNFPLGKTLQEGFYNGKIDEMVNC